MDELMDMIANDQSPSLVSDKIKELLFSRSAEKIDNFRTSVADSLFNGEVEDEE